MSAILKVKKWHRQHFGQIVFGVKCFNCDTTILYLRNIPAWNKDDIEVVVI